MCIYENITERDFVCVQMLHTLSLWNQGQEDCALSTVMIYDKAGVNGAC